MTNMQISIWLRRKSGQNFPTYYFQTLVKQRLCIETPQNSTITKRNFSMHLQIFVWVREYQIWIKIFFRCLFRSSNKCFRILYFSRLHTHWIGLLGLTLCKLHHIHMDRLVWI